MQRYSNELSRNFPLVIVTLALVLTAAPITILLATESGLLAGSVTILIFLAVFIVSRFVYISQVESKARGIRLVFGALLAGIILILNTGGTVLPALVKLFNPYLKKYAPLLADLEAQPQWLTALALILFAAVAGIGVWRLTSRAALPSNPARDLATQKSQQYRTQLTGLASELAERLVQLDQRTRWQDHQFVPLQAEIELLSPGLRKRYSADLITAISAEGDGRLFIVLGEPGSGKSVALRKLARELLPEIALSGHIPIYVNLREFPASSGTRIDQKTIKQFVIRQITATLSIPASDFLQGEFDTLYANGQLFLIFDSFDELPAILDAGEDDPLMLHISREIIRFLTPGDRSRGLIASRYYKQPGVPRSEYKIFHVKPFAEEQIIAAIRQQSSYSKIMITEILARRPDLYVLARNPFTLSLLIEYVNAHHGNFPTGQAEMYASFIDRELSAIRGEIQAARLDNNVIKGIAARIALYMFEIHSTRTRSGPRGFAYSCMQGSDFKACTADL